MSAPPNMALLTQILIAKTSAEYSPKKAAQCKEIILSGIAAMQATDKLSESQRDRLIFKLRQAQVRAINKVVEEFANKTPEAGVDSAAALAFIENTTTFTRVSKDMFGIKGRSGLESEQAMLIARSELDQLLREHMGQVPREGQ